MKEKETAKPTAKTTKKTAGSKKSKAVKKTTAKKKTVKKAAPAKKDVYSVQTVQISTDYFGQQPAKPAEKKEEKPADSEIQAKMRQFIKHADMDGVILLLSNGFKDEPDTFGETALQRAVHDQQTAIVKLLLENGADPSYVNKKYDESVLLTAVKTGNTTLVKLLLENGAVITPDENGETIYEKTYTYVSDEMSSLLRQHLPFPVSSPFAKWAEMGNLEMLKKFIVRANPEEKNEAFVKASTIQVLKFLLDNGVDVNATHVVTKNVFPSNKISSYKTALQSACWLNLQEKVRFLIAHGADVNKEEISVRNNPATGEQQTLHGHSPLMIAVQNRNLPLVNILLVAGADPNLTYPNGLNKTALDLAREDGVLQIISVLEKAGAQKTEFSSQKFLEAAFSGDEDYVRTHLKDASPEDKINAFVHATSLNVLFPLLQNGVNVNAPYEQKLPDGKTASYTALWNACRCKQANKIRLLINQKADVNRPYRLINSDRSEVTLESPLMMLVAQENEQLAEVLLKAGADVNYSTSYRETASTVAVDIGYETLQELLQKYGANKPLPPTVIDEAFVEAASNGDLKYVKKNISHTDSDTKKAAFVAAKTSEILEFLIQCGVNINDSYLTPSRIWEEDEQKIYFLRWTSLLQACCTCNIPKAIWLIEKGADVNIPIIYETRRGEVMPKGGESALMFAAATLAKDLVELLLIKGADIHYTNSQDVNVFTRALRAEDGDDEHPIYTRLREWEKDHKKK